VAWIDSAWDAVHSVVRPIGGALLSMAIIDGADPAWQVGSFLLGGGAAFLAHAGKAGARALVNASPEPVSNIVVSTGEDIATAGLLGLAIANPIAAALIALILVLLSVWLVIAARRALRRFLEPKRPQTG
jgi:F0F1-type ATP synthase assembly protein I